MSRLFDRTGSIVALALSVPVIVFGCTQRPDAANVGVDEPRVADEHLARGGAPTESVDRWSVSGCTTDSDCQDMEDFVAVVCANESREACDVVIAQMFLGIRK